MVLLLLVCCVESQKRLITHSTRLSSPRGRDESTGFLPVMSSRSTTPKEKTSDFSVSFPVDAYSGAKYLYVLKKMQSSQPDTRLIESSFSFHLLR